MRRSFVLTLSAAASIVAAGAGAAASVLAAHPTALPTPMIGEPWEFRTAVVALDADGARYVAGTYFPSNSGGGLGPDFDPGEGVERRFAAPGYGADVFVTKFDAAGRWRWSQTFVGTREESAHALLVANGVLYVGGGFRSVDAGVGALGTISSRAADDSEAAAYVLALDAATGEPRTSFGAGGVVTFGSPAKSHANVKSFTSDGPTLFVGGDFGSDAFGIGGEGTIGVAGSADGFVAALDAASGAPRPSFGARGIQTLSGAADEFVAGVALASGRLFVAGQTGSADFGVGGTKSAAAAGTSDAFVAALDPATGAKLDEFGGDGIVLFGGSGGDDARGLAAADERVYVTGVAAGSDVRIDDSDPARPTPGGHDIYVLALDARTGAPASEFAGGVQWFGSASDESGSPVGIAVSGGGVYVAGSVPANLQFGIGGSVPGNLEEVHTFILGLDAATGGPLSDFSFQGVVRITPGPERSVSAEAFASGPAGLALAGTVKSGGSPVPASIDFGGGHASIPQDGEFLALFDPATGAPRNVDAARFLSPPILTQNPAVAGRPVHVTALFEATPGVDTRSITWDWGDGTVTAGRTKTYAVPGTYVVRAMSYDRIRTVLVTSDPTTLIVLPAGTPHSDLTRAAVRLAFGSAGRDEILLQGSLRVTGDAPLAGRVFSVDVGGVARSFTLDDAGRATQGADNASVGAQRDGVARFSVRLRGTFAAQFADEGMTASRARRAYVPTDVFVALDLETQVETMPLVWSNRDGRTGVAR